MGRSRASRSELDEYEAIQTLGRASLWGTADEPPPRLATGTREMDRLQCSDPDLEADLEVFPYAALLIDEEDCIVALNRRVEYFFGVAREQLLGQPLARLVTEIAPRVSDGGHTAQLRLVRARACRCDGAVVTVELMTTARDDGRQIVVMPSLAPGRDVDGDDEIAEIVHDLKNPLSTIGLEICLLGAKLGLVDKEVRATLARMSDNVTYLDRLIQDLLDSRAIEADQLVLRRGHTDMRELLEQVIDRAIPTRDRWRVFLDAEQPALAVIDALRIERVVANLLANALKYAPRDSGVVVRLERLDTAIRVSVIDAGTNLRPEDLGHLFDKYRRARTATRHEGSGLGLYVSRKIVEAHGGRIDVECAPGSGTRFFFELPRSR